MSVNKNVLKGLISLAVESSLFVIDHEAYDRITKYLTKNHNCYLPDCLENPEYLKNALTNLYDKSYNDITSQIKERLRDFTYHEDIKRFVDGLERP